MTDLRTKLRSTTIRQEVIEFVCLLTDLLEFNERLKLPCIYPTDQGGVELVWHRRPNTIRLLVNRPGHYKFSAEIEGQGEVLNGETNGRGLVQQLRNMLLWLWDDPW